MAGKRIKIFVDAHCFDKEFQGAQTFIRELYTQLMTDHPDVDVYMGACNVANISKQFPDLATSNILPYKKRGINLLRFAFDIPAYIKQYRFDFAHFQYLSPQKIPGCRYVVTMHDMLFNDFKEDFPFPYRVSRSLMFGNSIKNADIKTTVSSYSKGRICSYYNIPDSKVHIIQNGVNNAMMGFQQSKQEAEALVKQKFGIKNFILYTSRVEPRKNHLLLLKKYLKLGLYRQGIALVFIGKESIKTPALIKLIDSMSAEQRAMFLWIRQAEPADLAAFYRACKFFVYPSKAEGFGIPPLEAAMCQAPVLCSSETAMKNFEFFTPHTFDPANDADFEQKLSQMALQPPTAAFISRVAEEIKLQYNWQNSSNLFYNLLQTSYIAS